VHKCRSQQSASQPVNQYAAALSSVFSPNQSARGALDDGRSVQSATLNDSNRSKTVSLPRSSRGARHSSTRNHITTHRQYRCSARAQAPIISGQPASQGLESRRRCPRRCGAACRAAAASTRLGVSVSARWFDFSRRAAAAGAGSCADSITIIYDVQMTSVARVCLGACAR
jgi:hypothetical protein